MRTSSRSSIARAHAVAGAEADAEIAQREEGGRHRAGTLAIEWPVSMAYYAIWSGRESRRRSHSMRRSYSRTKQYSKFGLWLCLSPWSAHNMGSSTRSSMAERVEG